MDAIELVDPVLLRSFVAVSEARSFTTAARLLGLRQSAVSQHVARLERRYGRQLLARDTHGVALTPDGDALLPHAREVLAEGARIERYLSGVRLRGRVRLGASEDFVSGALSDVLTEFARHHECVDVELTVAMSGQLYPSFDAGELDLILTKRRSGDRRGRVAWSEPLGAATAQTLQNLLDLASTFTSGVAVGGLLSEFVLDPGYVETRSM